MTLYENRPNRSLPLSMLCVLCVLCCAVSRWRVRRVERPPTPSTRHDNSTRSTTYEATNITKNILPYMASSICQKILTCSFLEEPYSRFIFLYCDGNVCVGELQGEGGGGQCGQEGTTTRPGTPRTTPLRHTTSTYVTMFLDYP
jgi:hypothetical protein